MAGDTRSEAVRRRILEAYEQLREWGRERLAREEAERQTQEDGAIEDNGKPLEPDNAVSNADSIAESKPK